MSVASLELDHIFAQCNVTLKVQLFQSQVWGGGRASGTENTPPEVTLLAIVSVHLLCMNSCSMVIGVMFSWCLIMSNLTKLTQLYVLVSVHACGICMCIYPSILPGVNTALHIDRDDVYSPFG